MEPRRLSLVLPVWNGAEHLPELLRALGQQTVASLLELIAIDSGSRDDSVSQLMRFDALPTRVLEIPAGTFDHGETRNQGAREATGELVVFLSQDAIPTDSRFVERLVGSLERDERLAGVFARQIPRDDADAVTRERLSQWVACSQTPRRTYLESPFELDSRPPLARLDACAFDNVASAVRRSLLLAHPFERTRFGEDVEWAARMLRLGHGIAYEPSAAVRHSHQRRAVDLFRRHYLAHRMLSRVFGLVTLESPLALVRAGLGQSVLDLSRLVGAGARLSRIWRSPVEAVAEKLGQYQGARDERLGRPYPSWA